MHHAAQRCMNSLPGLRSALHTQPVPGCTQVVGPESRQSPCQDGSSEPCPPACLTSSDGWALHREHNFRGPGGWGGVPNCAQFWQGKLCEKAQGAWFGEPIFVTGLGIF
eukprot:469453-Pelagomonas_calceolata.AAC.1